MKVLFVSHAYPPETNATATRLYEHVIHWQGNDMELQVLTGCPRDVDGLCHPDFTNEYSVRTEDDVEVHRVPVAMLEKKGKVRRILLGLSFLVSALFYSRKTWNRPAVVIGTSPHVFTAIAGFLVAQLKRSPFILEVRDLWPETAVAADVFSASNLLVQMADTIVGSLYRHADGIVVVTGSMKASLIHRGVPEDKISVIPNSANTELFTPDRYTSEADRLRTEWGLNGKKVVSYIGNVGRSQGASTLASVAERSEDDDVIFLVVGSGAEWEDLNQMKETRGLENLRLVESMPKGFVPVLLAVSDISLVYLKDRTLFEGVIPSKIFEAMAMANPIVIAVKGEARRLVVEEANAGMAAVPENAESILKVVNELADDPTLRKSLGQAGREAVLCEHNRERRARQYASFIMRIGS